MKKLLSVLIVCLVMLTACKGENPSKNTSNANKNTTVSGSQESTSEKTFTVGILQFAQHGSLDNCREGFIQGLADEGFIEGKNVIYDYQNAQADMALVSQIADSFVAKNYDLIVAIATPAAMGAFNATLNTDIPVVYTAVSDPVQAQLADENKNPKGNITGTSDELPVEAQLKMIREILPEAKKIGILYTSSEANSQTMIKQYTELVDKYNFELVTKAINTSSDIPLATDNILNQVDCLTNLLDNTVVNSLPTILEKANNANIPVFGSEIEQVRIGSLGAEGVEYISLGKQTGSMAARVLNGESADSIPYETIKESNLYLNEKVAENLGITLSDTLKNRTAELFSKIENPNTNK